MFERTGKVEFSRKSAYVYLLISLFMYFCYGRVAMPYLTCRVSVKNVEEFRTNHCLKVVIYMHKRCLPTLHEFLTKCKRKVVPNSVQKHFRKMFHFMVGHLRTLSVANITSYAIE
jgi:hypothetical protein